MTRSTCWIYFGLLVAAVSQPSFAKSLKLNSETIAQVADQPLITSQSSVKFTVGEIYNQISESRMMIQGGMLNANDAKHVIDSIVVDSLLTLEGAKIDLPRYRLDYRDYLHQYHDSLIQAVVNIEIDSKAKADSLEVLQFFKDNPELFAAEEQVLIYHILLSPKGLVTKVDSIYLKTHDKSRIELDTKEMAYSIYQALKYGEAFRNMAYLFSHDAITAKKSGYVGWTPRGKYLDPFDSVAFSLKVGEFSQPYEDQDGWHIIKSEGYVPKGLLPIDSPYVYDMARSSLLTLRSNQRGAEFVDSLYRAATIVENPAIMDTDINTVDDYQWVGVVNNRDTMFAWEMKQHEPGLRLQNDINNTTPQMKRDVLHLMARRYLLAEAAHDRGIDSLPFVARFEREVRVRTCRDIVRRRGEDFTWTPTDSTIEQAYRDETKSIDISRPVTVQDVAVKDSVFAIFLKDQANSGVPFEDFTKKEFLDAVNPGAKVKLSGVKRIGQKDVPEAYWKAIFGIETGHVSGVFRIKDKFYIARVLGRIVTQNVLSSRGNIRVRLESEHRRKVWNNFRDELYRTYGVRYANTVESLALKPFKVRNANQANAQ